jgi:hypothetical protein
MEDFGHLALQRLLANHGGDVIATHADHGDATACIDSECVIDVFEF